ncbi:MAG: hypothetical protein OXU96_03010 [Gammaproteobacteria bacterium]|nr:hypothetical protein [Gammaproteobacteria bacterium]
MINIVAAFAGEARPFIDALSLGLQPGCGPFVVYERGDARLIISGMGVDSAEAAVRFLSDRADTANRWLNFGIAGSAQFGLGMLVVARRVCGPSSGESWRCYRPPALSWPDAVVRSVERPETAYAKSGVYDMEAAGICRALGPRRCAAELSCIKLITDGPGRPASRLDKKTIRAMLAKVGPQLAHLPGALQQTDPQTRREET